MAFIPLHIYSGYSFLQSGLSLRKIVALGIKRGYGYVGLSDYQTMTGFPELHHLCKDHQMNPLFGMDAEFDGNLFTLYVENETGYRNLIALCHKTSIEKLSLEDLYAHQEGLSVVLCPEHSFFKFEQEKGIDEMARRMQAIQKRVSHLSIGIPYLPSDPLLVAFVRQFIAKYPYPCLAFPHILYEKKEDAIALRIVEAIHSNETLEEKQFIGTQHYLTDEEISNYYSDVEINGCMILASNLSFELIAKRGKLLQFPNELGMDSVSYLKKKALEGLAKRKPDFDETYKKRLDYELDVIISMGYSDYFLVVADYVNHAREMGITVGPSRGSAAGSLVAYALDIVLLDPIKYGLLFERFLNPKRQSLPDIDIDFADIRREQVVQYLQDKYGKNRVSNIVTMQTLGAKASLRDIGRVFDYPPREIDMIAKSIEYPLKSLGENYRLSKKFKELVDSDPYYLQIVSLAHKIEGLPRQAGLHAAGIILNDEPLEESIPVSEAPDGSLTCGYEMLYLEEQGFLKMDLLSLRNLTIIDNAISIIEATEHVLLDPRTLDYEDKGAISMIAKGKVMGLFQLESSGMKKTISHVQPTTFEDVASVIALYRPGPMDFIASFAGRKHGKEKVEYPIPSLESILAPTYGIIVYQEQIMQIARLMAGFDFGQADLFRRAISKKDAAKLASLKNDFISGCLANGHKEEVSEKVFALIDKFANYGFPKAHAYGYAVITCQMAYLKYHHELAFYCAILNEVSPGDRAFMEIFQEMQRSHISFKIPDINESELSYFPCGKDAIRFPLLAIKGLNSKLLVEIVNERKARGPYQDIYDFSLRTKQYGIKLEHLVRLIDAGCFDSIYPHRASLRLSASSAIDYAELFSGTNGNEILLDLQFPKPALKEIDDTPSEDLAAEKEALGMLLSMSPLFEKQKTIAERHLLTIEEATSRKEGGAAAAVIASVRQITTKKGNKMMFLLIYDQYSQIEVTLFERDITPAFALLRQGEMIEIYLRKDDYRPGAFIGSRIASL